MAENNLSGKESHQNIMEKAVGGMMSGGSHNVDAHPDYTIEVGNEYGLTQFSEEANTTYGSTRGSRSTLDASDYYAVVMGYLREHVCMGRCNLYIQVFKTHAVTEMRNILQDGGYELPAPYNGVADASDIDELGSIETGAIDDRMLMTGHIFSVEGFMNRWNHVRP